MSKEPSTESASKKDFNRRTIVATGTSVAALGAMGMTPVLAQDYTPTVLITGSNRGIGLEFARQYTEAGWNVIATARKPKSADDLQALADANDNITIEKLDVTDYKGIDKLSKKYEDQPIDVLLNNAGIFTEREGQLLENLNYEDFERTMAVNAYGPLKMAQAFVEQLAASEQKKVVTIASGLGSVSMAGRGMGGGMYYYRMSKAAVNMAMVKLRGEVEPRGIIVGIIGPGMVQTRLLEASGFKGQALTPAQSAEAVMLRIARLTPEDSGKFYNLNGDNELPW